jgi:hypothetical protein
MEKIPFYMGISVPVDLIVIIIFFLNSIFHKLGCRLMKIFISQTWLSSFEIS